MTKATRPKKTATKSPPQDQSAVVPVPDAVEADSNHVDIRIDRNGTWRYCDSPIHRKELVCLFASSLTRDERGDFWLVTPTERVRIEVEDAPFIAVELFAAGAGREQILSVRTNVDEIVTIDEAHPLEVITDPQTEQPSPYVRLRDGIDARLARSVYYEVVARGVEEKIGEEQFYGIWSAGQFFPLGRLNDPA